MVHFRLLALGLAASTASVALAVDAVCACVATCNNDASHNGSGCKWDDVKCVLKSDKLAGNFTDCVKKTCPTLAEKVKALNDGTCGPKSTLKHLQKAERKSERKAPVGGHHHGDFGGKHKPDHQHKARSTNDHDHKHDHGHDDKDKHGHEGKHQDQGKHGDKPHAKHDDAGRAVHSHVPDGPRKFKPVSDHHGHTKPTPPRHGKHGEAVSKHHGEQERTREPGHLGKHAVKSTTEQQGKHGVNKFSPVHGQRGPYDDMPIPKRHGKHGVEPDSKHHHGEHEHDDRGKKPPRPFKPEFVPAYQRAPKSDTHHVHRDDKGTSQPEGHGKTSAGAPHGAHASDKKAPGTTKEGSKKQPEKQPKSAPKSGDKGNPSAKSAAGHAAETPKGEVTAAQCEAKALEDSKTDKRHAMILKCQKGHLQCICNTQKYHGSLVTCGSAANNATFETSVDKYLTDCRNAGYSVASLPKDKQGGKPQPGAYGEAGKKPASSDSTDQHPGAQTEAGKNPASSNSTGQHPGAQTEGGKNPASSSSTGQHPGAQTEAGKNPAGSNSTDQGPKENEPAASSPADFTFPACATPCISVAQKKTKSNCTTVACQCADSGFQTQFTACVSKTCNKVDYNETLTAGALACNAASHGTAGGDGSNNNNPNSNTNSPSSAPSVQNKKGSASGLRSSVGSVGAVLAGAIGVAFATLL